MKRFMKALSCADPLRPGHWRSRSATLALVALLLLGCNRQRPDFGTLPRVEVPFGESPNPAAKPIPPAKAKPKAPKPPSDPPDPPPLIQKEQIDFVLLFDKGEISVRSHKDVVLKLDTPSDRRVGRFAFEFFVGPTLIERVRFDFPLLGAGAPEDNDLLEGGLTTETKVRVPNAARATHARILDRKTRKIVAIDWPPASNGAAPPGQGSPGTEAQGTEAQTESPSDEPETP